MMDIMGKASNVLSVLMNQAVVERVEVVLNGNRQPTKIVAVLVDKNEAKDIGEMFAVELGCGYGCSTAGVDADTEKGTVTISRDKIHDKEAYDLLIQTMLMLL